MIAGLHKKISNLGPEKKLMTNLPKRPPVDIEFNNLSYSGDHDGDNDDDDDGNVKQKLCYKMLASVELDTKLEIIFEEEIYISWHLHQAKLKIPTKTNQNLPFYLKLERRITHTCKAQSKEKGKARS